jgi:prepilin-type N-terminal cleavage/methylation domain-containing protein
MKMTNKPDGNKGFSLIEVIVVVLILGIVSTIAVLSVSYAYSSSANHCAKRLAYLLDYTRMQSMGMVDGTVCLRLEVKGDGSINAISIKDEGGVETVLDTEEIGNSNLTIYYTDSVGEKKLLANHSIDFKYSKNSGAFNASTTPYSSIRVEGSKTAILVLVRETGRNYIN